MYCVSCFPFRQAGCVLTGYPTRVFAVEQVSSSGRTLGGGGRVRLTGSWFWDSYKGGPNLETKATYTPQTLPAYPLCQRTQTVMLTHVFKLSENCILDKLSCIVDYCRKANVRNNSVDFPANFKRTNRTKIRSDCSSKTVLSKGGSSNESESRK